MAGLRAGNARSLQGGVDELRAKARPTECGKVGCRAACPQAAADVCGNEKPCGLCCRGRRPRRPAEVRGCERGPTVERSEIGGANNVCPCRANNRMSGPALLADGARCAPSSGQDPSLRCKGYRVVMARLRAGHARPPTDCRKRVADERGEGGRQPGPFRVRRLPGNGRPRTARRNPPVR